jgi:hypothetical protein
MRYTNPASLAFLLIVLPALTTTKDKTTFIALGDAPYCDRAEQPLTAFLTKLSGEHKPAFLIHVGDIQGSDKGEPCTKAAKRVGDLTALTGARLLFTPGDNDWRDCVPNVDEDAAGKYKASLKELGAAAQNAGIGLPGVERDPRRIENARLRVGPLYVVVIHELEAHDGKKGSREVVAELERQGDAWLRASLSKARKSNAAGVVVAAQSRLPGAWKIIEEHVAEWKKPVLLVTGDKHDWIWEPAKKDSHVSWLQVVGDPRVGAAVVTFDAASGFAVEEKPENYETAAGKVSADYCP